MIESFTRHPAQVGETYGGHMRTAFGFGFTMIGAGLACVLHGLFPFLFVRTGSQCVERLHARMSCRNASAHSHGAAPIKAVADAER
ncbi:DUF6356 family protein [Caulobacter sp. NIBR2454]|uniref:DUF6356 family protein n=1 Tax=Caulobacter sp. NIBR2454 TaxID=3015996 RepID=UPI0022B618E0|nr:DUF6356 family protein [Caulobacter sp. NIBR2454]